MVLKVRDMVWYAANQSYIATELCEQRDVVENQCQGNCLLSKKLQLAEQTNTKETPVIISDSKVSPFLMPISIYEEECSIFTLSKSPPFIVSSVTPPFIEGLLRPPAILS